MANELLTPDEMALADRLTIAAGPADGRTLMERAGAAVAAAVLRGYESRSSVDVLCGPGNNGGDGYVAARLLAEAGVAVRLWRLAPPKTGTDAAAAAAACPLPAKDLSAFAPLPGSVVVDALFGAGLAKPLAGAAAAAAAAVRQAGVPVVAVDLPSGVSGMTGAVLGTAFRADHTITFFCKKPGHLLHPGKLFCGKLELTDIGIPQAVLPTIRPSAYENGPDLFVPQIRPPAVDTHKYARGHVAVFSGGAAATGAARLASLAAQRAGAGAVTLLSPPDALLVNAAHLTSIILRRCAGQDEALRFLAERKPGALVLGPGFGIGEETAGLALALIAAAGGIAEGLVFDADAITSLAGERAAFLFEAQRKPGRAALVLTPHEGEFGRLFPDLAGEGSKLDRAREAAARAGAVLIYKGPDTVIAAPDGRAAINGNGTAWLATAGSGDVLCGIVASLLAQGMPAFEAAAAAVWIHAEAARRFGAGLIAEDLPAALVGVMAELFDRAAAAAGRGGAG